MYFSLQTEKPAGFQFFLLLPVCCLFYFSQNVTPPVTLTGDASLTLSPIYQSGYKAHFPQVPQNRNSLWLLHSFSINCVKKQQNPSSRNMFPFLVLFYTVTISFSVSLTYRQGQAANSDQKFRDVCVLWACLPWFVCITTTNYINRWGKSDKSFCRSIRMPTVEGYFIPFKAALVVPKLVCKYECDAILWYRHAHMQPKSNVGFLSHLYMQRHQSHIFFPWNQWGLC